MRPTDLDLHAPTENAAISRRRRILVALTLAVGTALLAGTLAAPSDSALFYSIGVAAGLAWIVGALVSGPLRARRPHGRDAAVGAVLGVALFLAFLAAKAVTDAVPVLADSVARVLDRADDSDRALVLTLALVNGLGEELFFRGAVYAAFERHRPALWSTVIYCLVTVATLNLALVAAALVMGAVFAWERRATGSVLAPVVTHLTWTTLMITLLPR